MENNTKLTFSELIKGSEIPVLVDFYADWCGPCKSLAPILSNFSERNKGKVKVIKIDIDKNQHAANAYQVQAVPTLLMFFKGKIVWRQAGLVPESHLNQVLSDFELGNKA